MSDPNIQIKKDRKKAWYAAWAAANPEKVKAKNAAYRATHPDKARVSSAAWLAANPEKQKARSAAYRAANPEKNAIRVAAWAAANPEARCIIKQNRRARMKQVGGVLSKGLSKKLFRLQKGKCPCCGEPLGENYHMDHVVPLALGGSNTDDNMQLLRQRCNHQKHAKHPIDFMQSKGFLL